MITFRIIKGRLQIQSVVQIPMSAGFTSTPFRMMSCWNAANGNPASKIACLLPEQQHRVALCSTTSERQTAPGHCDGLSGLEDDRSSCTQLDCGCGAVRPLFSFARGKSLR